MTVDVSPDPRHGALSRSVFRTLPELEMARLASEVHESRLLANHLLYDPEVTVVVAGRIRAFIGDGIGRQATAAYLRPGNTLGLVHLAGRRYPVAFQAIEDTRLLVVGNERTRQLHQTHAALGWATIQELSASYLNDLETELASYASARSANVSPITYSRSPPKPRRRRCISPGGPTRSAVPARWSAAP